MHSLPIIAPFALSADATSNLAPASRSRSTFFMSYLFNTFL